MGIELVYKFNNDIFQVGDVVKIIHKNIFTGELNEYIGSISKAIIGRQLELDISEKYKSNKISLELDEIVNIEYITK